MSNAFGQHRAMTLVKAGCSLGLVIALRMSYCLLCLCQISGNSVTVLLQRDGQNMHEGLVWEVPPSSSRSYSLSSPPHQQQKQQTLSMDHLPPFPLIHLFQFHAHRHFWYLLYSSFIIHFISSCTSFALLQHGDIQYEVNSPTAMGLHYFHDLVARVDASVPSSLEVLPWFTLGSLNGDRPVCTA